MKIVIFILKYPSIEMSIFCKRVKSLSSSSVKVSLFSRRCNFIRSANFFRNQSYLYVLLSREVPVPVFVAIIQIIGTSRTRWIKKYKTEDAFSGMTGGENRCPSSVSIEVDFHRESRSTTSVRHRVQDPVHVISDPGVDSGDARGTALPRPETDHAVLNDARRVAVVYAESLQRPAAVAEAGIHVAQTAGAQLFVPDLGRPPERLPALIVGHQRQLRLQKVLTTRTHFRRAPAGHYRLSIGNGEDSICEIGRERIESLEKIER